MNNQVFWNEYDDTIRERYELTIERIGKLTTEQTVVEPYRSYFIKVADFILSVDKFLSQPDKSDQDWRSWNRNLYQDILPDAYEHSYANPQYAARCMGTEYGPVLSYLYAEIRGIIPFAYEHRMLEITLLTELFVEIYNVLESPDHQCGIVKDRIYWFVSDNSDRMVSERMKETLDPQASFALNLICSSNLEDPAYLYRFGEYISETELRLATFLSGLPQTVIHQMADTYVNGYVKGFEVTGRNLSNKSNVVIRYQLGFERVVRRAIETFREQGLAVIIYRAPVWSLNKTPNRRVGYHGISPNQQYDYDHRYDHAIYWNKLLKERKLAVMKAAYEQHQDLAGELAGPAVIETFGEAGFKPVNKPEAPALNEKQEQLWLQYSNEAAQMGNLYIPGDEISFTIIAFPLPSIGAEFEAIFFDTIKINTLDYERYRDMQQIIIDTLDQASQVRITGKGNNQTDLMVMLPPLKNPDKETNFENCVADVNIPLGEVFTSPRLSGTNGLLHVSSVFIGGIQFKELRMWFENGMVKDYSCENFTDVGQGRDLVRQVILKNHDTLPMGEFAIGTNTAAYAMARKYGIIDKLPILIVEKMGPHFAVGDTCYRWSEDAATYNFDGKMIAAKDNEISRLRKEDLSKAYFNCHTDITLPYDELDQIQAIKNDRPAATIIAGGKFVLEGIEALNKPLTEV